MNLATLGLSGVWEPGSANPTEGPFLVVLHGRGDSAEGFAWMKTRLQIPGLSVLRLNAPDEYYTGYSWYDLPPGQLPGIVRSRELLTKAFTEIFAQGYSPARCVLFGFSQGCLMTLEFGMRYPALLAGCVGVSGYCYDLAALIREANPVVRTGNWLVTHGTQDDVLPIERTRAQMQELNAAGFPIEYREYEKDHTIDPRDELPFIREWIAQRLMAQS